MSLRVYQFIHSIHCNTRAEAYKIQSPHTAYCKRDRSRMGLITNDLRNRMGQDTPDYLMCIGRHRYNFIPISLSIEAYGCKREEIPTSTYLWQVLKILSFAALSR